MLCNAPYEACPQEAAVGPPSLSSDSEPAVREHLAATVEFLLAEGHIRGFQVADGSLAPYGLTRTAKGLAILNAVPDSVQSKAPLGQRLGATLRSGGREVVNAVISQVVSAAATGRIPGT
jgi:hypothetical protein